MKQTDPGQAATERSREVLCQYLDLFNDPQNFASSIGEISRAFGQVGRELVPACAEVLDHADSRRRMLAAWLLLFVAQQNPRLVAAPTLGRAKRVIVKALEDADRDLRIFTCAFLQLGGVPTDAYRPLKRLLEDREESLQVLAAAALSAGKGTAAASGILALGRLLNSKDMNVVVVAACALGRAKVRSQEAVRHLTSAFSKLSHELLIAVIQALKEIGPVDGAASDLLTGAAEDPTLPPFVRGEAAEALGYVTRGRRSAVATLLKLLKSDDWQLVAGAADGLIACGHFPPEAVKLLGQRLSADDFNLRGTAAVRLGYLEAEALPALEPLLARLKEEPRLDVLHEIMGALGGIGPPAIEPLIKMLKQGDARSLMGISGALFRIGEQAAAAVAVAVLRDDNETVRDIGLQILLQMRDKAAPAVPALVALLDEVDEERRTHIMVSLLLCGRAALQAAPALVQRLATGDENMAWWAAQVLRKFGTDAVPYLEAGKSAADSVGRERIDRLLGEFKPAAAAGFERLAQWKCDQHLAVFVVWGELLEANSPCSMRNVAALLRSGAAYEDYGYKIGRSEGTFRNALKSLERKQKSRLISRKEGGQIVRLNEAGRELLARAREYLRWRRGPRDDSANQLSS